MRVPARHMLASALMLVMLAAASPPAQTTSDPTVYVTRTGAKYHRDGCSSLSRSRIPMKLSAASKTYGACKICRPPVALIASTVAPRMPADAVSATRAPIRDGRCQATTKKGARCKRKARAGTTFCWQHTP
jgi:hypothetical protein